MVQAPITQLLNKVHCLPKCSVNFPDTRNCSITLGPAPAVGSVAGLSPCSGCVASHLRLFDAAAELGTGAVISPLTPPPPLLTTCVCSGELWWARVSGRLTEDLGDVRGVEECR